MFLNYLVPYLLQEQEYYKYEKSVEFPLPKKTKHYKVNYFVNQDFLSQFSSPESLREIEGKIENEYEDYLKKACEEAEEKQRNLKTRLVYYKEGSYNYNLLNNELKGLNMKICEKLGKFRKKKARIDEEREEE